MPNCFTLTRKSAPEAGPVKFTVIDEELCKHFKAPCDPVKWYCYWYDLIGLGLACGRTFGQLIARYSDAFMDSCDPFDYQLCAIAMYLDEHFTTAAWYQVGK